MICIGVNLKKIKGIYKKNARVILIKIIRNSIDFRFQLSMPGSKPDQIKYSFLFYFIKMICIDWLKSDLFDLSLYVLLFFWTQMFII